jgi:hypothetical protein
MSPEDVKGPVLWLIIYSEQTLMRSSPTQLCFIRQQCVSGEADCHHAINTTFKKMMFMKKARTIFATSTILPIT